MCEKRLFLSYLFLLWALFSAVGQSSASPKTVILENLKRYQTILQEAKSSIDSLTKQTENLSSRIAELEQMLIDSNESSQAIVESLKLELAESNRQLLISQVALEDQQATFKALSMAYENLERSLKRSRRVATISTIAAVILGILAL